MVKTECCEYSHAPVSRRISNMAHLKAQFNLHTHLQKTLKEYDSLSFLLSSHECPMDDLFISFCKSLDVKEMRNFW